MQINFKISVITKYVLRYLIKYIFIKKLSFPKFGNKFSNRFDFIRGCFWSKDDLLKIYYALSFTKVLNFVTTTSKTLL